MFSVRYTEVYLGTLYYQTSTAAANHITCGEQYVEATSPSCLLHKPVQPTAASGHVTDRAFVRPRKQVQTINVLGIHNASLDIAALTDFADESGISTLRECFAKLVELVDIVLT